MNSEALASVRSVADLLQWYDRAFVELAYLVMLQRPADTEGAAYYLRKIRAGASRVAILDQLAKSVEADPLWGQVSGLEQLLHRYKRLRSSPRWWWQGRSDVEMGDAARVKRARALENAIGRGRLELIEMQENMKAEYGALRGLVSTVLNNQGGGAAMQAGVGAPRQLAHLSFHKPHIRSMYDVRDFDLPSSSRRIFEKLRV